MNRIWPSVVVAVVGSVVLAAQQAPPLTEQPLRIVKSDSGLDELIAPDARLELMAEHIGLSEGPLWIREGAGGYLIFSDVAANVICKRAIDGALSVLLERSGYTGTDNLNVGQQTISGGRVGERHHRLTGRKVSVRHGRPDRHAI